MKSSNLVFVSLACLAFQIHQCHSSKADRPEQPGQKPICKDWKLIAGADLIVKAKLHLCRKEIELLKKKNQYDYAMVPFDIIAVAKGPANCKTASIRYYLGSNSNCPTPSLIVSLNNKEAILFLKGVESRSTNTLYFAGHTPAALTEYEEATYDEVQKEVEQQGTILQKYDTKPLLRGDSMYEQVKQLVDKLTEEKTETPAWEKLVSLPQTSVPALIRAMKDDRKLAFSNVAIPTAHSGFESIAHYGPTTVMEAISILLVYKTDAGFDYADNVTSDQQRDSNINKWKIWGWYSL
jgi:hypothetical protein